MRRIYCLSISLLLHGLAWWALAGPTGPALADGGPAMAATGSDSQPVLSSELVQVNKVPPTEPEPELQAANASPDEKEASPLNYQSRRVEASTPTESSAEPGQIAVNRGAPAEADVESDHRSDDLTRESGAEVPLLRVMGLNQEWVDRLVAARVARIIVFDDRPLFLVTGTLSAPQDLQPILEPADLAGLSERMLPMSQGLARPILDLIGNQQSPRTPAVRLALTAAFDRYLLDRQRAAVQAAERDWKSVHETCGRFQTNAQGQLVFLVESVK